MVFFNMLYSPLLESTALDETCLRDLTGFCVDTALIKFSQSGCDRVRGYLVNCSLLGKRHKYSGMGGRLQILC